MAIYYVYYFVLLGIGALLQFLGALHTKKGKIFYLTVVFLALTFLSGARGLSVSYDAYAYAETFNSFASRGWIAPADYTHYMEYGFYIFCKLIAVCGGTSRTMFFLSSGIICFSLCKFLYHNSNHLLFSVLLILSFPYFYTSFDLIRNYLAISIVLLGVPYIQKRKIVPFLLCILLAMQFHKTALIFSVLYFLPYVKWNVLSGGILMVGTVLILRYTNQLAAVFSSFFHDYESYVSGSNSWWAGSFSGGIKTFLMYFVILLIALLAYNNKKQHSQLENQQLGMILLLTATALLFTNASIMLRFLVVFLPFMSVGLPDLLDDRNCIHQPTQVLYRYGTVLIAVAYHAFLVWNDWQDIVPYVPYWNA